MDIWKETNGGTWHYGNYAVNHAIFGIPCGSNIVSNLRLTYITDGTSNTVGVGEPDHAPGSPPNHFYDKLWAYRAPWNPFDADRSYSEAERAARGDVVYRRAEPPSHHRRVARRQPAGGETAS